MNRLRRHMFASPGIMSREGPGLIVVADAEDVPWSIFRVRLLENSGLPVNPIDNLLAYKIKIFDSVGIRGWNHGL